MNWLKHAQESNLGVCTSHAAVAGCCFLLVLGCLCNRDGPRASGRPWYAGGTRLCRAGGHWGVALVVFYKIYYLLLLILLLFPFIISLLLIIIAIILYLLFDNAELFT